MKKTIKRVTASLTAMLMMFGSTYTAVGSVSATNNEIQPRNSHVYGDVNDDSLINISDAVNILQFISAYKKEKYEVISVEAALRYREKKGDYYLKVPQAADVDGDGYITDADAICIQSFEAKLYDKIGRCGQLFYINE